MTWNGTTVNDDIFTHNLTSLPMTHQQKCLRSLGIIHKCNMHITGATDNVSLIDRLYYEWLGSLSEMKIKGTQAKTIKLFSEDIAR